MATSREPHDVMDRLLRQRGRSGGLHAAPGTPGTCPEAEMVSAYAEQRLSAAEAEAFERHAAGCERCQHVLALVADAQPLSGAAEAPAERSWWAAAWWRWVTPLAVTALAVTTYVALRPASGPSEVALKEVGETAPPQAYAPAPPPAAAPEAQAGAATAADARDQQALSAKPPAPTQPTTSERDSARFRVAGRAEREASPAFAERKREQRPAEQRAKVAASAEQRATAAAAAANEYAAAPAVAEMAPSAPAPAPIPAAPVPPPAGAPAERQAPAPGALEQSSQVRAQAAKMRAADAAADARATWFATASSPDGTSMWRVGAAGAIERSRDRGATWTRLGSPVTADLLSASAPSASVCWAGGRGGVVLVTTDGTTWSLATPPGAIDIVRIDARDSRHATVTTGDGRWFTTRDGGRLWERER